MKSRLTVEHRFVDCIPDALEERVVYVAIDFATVVHRCCCGCAKEVVTPLSPKDWSLTFDGESISLNPSIGNWSFECQSHYWIRGNSVQWAPRWSKAQIETGRAYDFATRGNAAADNVPSEPSRCDKMSELQEERRSWRWLANLWRRFGQRN